MLLPLDQCWADQIWRSPYRLRFELSMGDSYVGMFTRAYDRARKLARAALPIDRPFGIIAAYGSAYWTITSDDREATDSTDTRGFGLLKQMGVSTDKAEASWEGPFDPDGDPCEHRAARLTWDEADILLWNNLAQEMGVEPRAPVLARLADPERGVVVDPYDDRGMDITALSPDPIEHLYRRFDTWLLEHDRPRMAEVFGRRVK